MCKHHSPSSYKLNYITPFVGVKKKQLAIYRGPPCITDFRIHPRSARNCFFSSKRTAPGCFCVTPNSWGGRLSSCEVLWNTVRLFGVAIKACWIFHGWYMFVFVCKKLECCVATFVSKKWWFTLVEMINMEVSWRFRTFQEEYYPKP